MRPAVLFITILFAEILSAQVYKWVDEDGKTHYGDKPQSENAENVEIRAAPGPDPDHESRVAKQRRLLDVMQEERQESRQLKEKAALEKQQRQQKCIEARKKLQDIKKARYLYRKSDDPENPLIYSDEERNRITLQAEKAVQQWCR